MRMSIAARPKVAPYRPAPSHRLPQCIGLAPQGQGTGSTQLAAQLSPRDETHFSAAGLAKTARAARLPLYLIGPSSTTIAADGPALKVQRVGQAPKRYPLSRIARIIAGPRVEWRTSALAACQREGLPIVFLGPTGVPSGWLQPARCKTSRLNGVIEEIVSRPDWRGYYDCWLRSTRMKMLQAWRCDRHAQASPVVESDFREMVRCHVYRFASEVLSFPSAALHSAALTAYALQTLQRAGLKPQYWGDHGKALDLADDLARLLGLDLHLEMHGLGAAMHGDAAAMLHFLHQFNDRLDRHRLDLLGSLHQCFKSTLEAWR